MTVNPIKAPAPALECDRKTSPPCGSRCNIAMPIISPPTPLINNWVRKCVIRSKLDSLPPANDAATIIRQ